MSSEISLSKLDELVFARLFREEYPAAATVSGAALLVALVVCALVYFGNRRLPAAFRPRSAQKPSSYPPGPRPLPVLGNLFDLWNVTFLWERFTEWKAQYGNVIGLRALGTHVVVLNSVDVFDDLLSKRALKYSHRPTSTVVRELMNMAKVLPMRDYDHEWRETRRMLHTVMGPAPVKRYHETIADITAVCVREIMDDTKNYRGVLRSSSGRFVLAVTYGLPFTDKVKEHSELAERTLDVLRGSVLVGAYLCDIVPALKYLPAWVPFQRRMAEARKMVHDMVTIPYELVKQQIAAGTARPSLASDLLNQYGDGQLTPEIDDRILWTAASMYAAGSESTFATTLTFILAMVLNPEAQATAQSELDRVVGAGNLPRVEDRARLPYVDALVKETMRWHPILPLGFPRRTSEDDTYRGMHIPAGSIVLANVWSVAREPHPTYPPDKFHPERFLDPSCPVTDPSSWVFGFGRRVCPGRLVAENSVFLLISTILSVFSISAPTDDPGKFEMPKFVADLATFPGPFDCRMSVRSAEAEAAIRDRASRCSL